LGHLRSHDPPPGFLADARSRVDPEADAARAEIVSFLGLHARVAEKAGEKRAMDLRIRRGSLRGLPSQLRNQLPELSVHIAPLAHAVVRQEMLAAGLVQLAVRLPSVEPVVEELPELQPGEEVGLLVVELLLRLVCRAGPVRGPLAR